MAKTIQDTYRGLFQEGMSLSEIKASIDSKDELRLRRVMYGLADGVLMYLLFNLFRIFLQSMFGDDSEPTKESKDFLSTVNKKMLNESML